MATTSASVEIAARMAEAAAALLDALALEQRAKAMFDFEDIEERTSWAYFPRNHRGLPLLEMDPPQQKRAHALIACSLSRHAYGKVTTIMGLESVLNDIEGRTRRATPGAISSASSPRRAANAGVGVWMVTTSASTLRS